VHHRYQRHRWQIFHRCPGVVNCRQYQRHQFPLVSLALMISVANNGSNYQLSMNLKFFFLNANCTTQRCPKEIIKNFQIEDFFHLPWAANISTNFRKNSKRPYWYNQGLGGNWFMKKTRSKKSRDTFPLTKQNRKGWWMKAGQLIMVSQYGNAFEASTNCINQPWAVLGKILSRSNL
jgi:hypothetical protein